MTKKTSTWEWIENLLKVQVRMKPIELFLKFMKSKILMNPFNKNQKQHGSEKRSNKTSLPWIPLSKWLDRRKLTKIIPLNLIHKRRRKKPISEKAGGETQKYQQILSAEFMNSTKNQINSSQIEHYWFTLKHIDLLLSRLIGEKILKR